MILEWVLLFAAGYLALGVLFALPFVWLGIGQIDPDARRGSVGFRCAVFPGAALFWPYLLLRWRTPKAPPRECNAHRAASETRGVRG